MASHPEFCLLLSACVHTEKAASAPGPCDIAAAGPSLLSLGVARVADLCHALPWPPKEDGPALAWSQMRDMPFAPLGWQPRGGHAPIVAEVGRACCHGEQLAFLTLVFSSVATPRTGPPSAERDRAVASWLATRAPFAIDIDGRPGHLGVSDLRVKISLGFARRAMSKNHLPFEWSHHVDADLALGALRRAQKSSAMEREAGPGGPSPEPAPL